MGNLALHSHTNFTNFPFLSKSGKINFSAFFLHISQKVITFAASIYQTGAQCADKYVGFFCANYIVNTYSEE